MKDKEVGKDKEKKEGEKDNATKEKKSTEEIKNEEKDKATEQQQEAGKPDGGESAENKQAQQKPKLTL